MKRCTTCNRTFTDESLLFCADDGTQLVSEAAPAEPLNAAPASLPTIAASAPYTPPPPPPPASSYQPTPKKKKWLALIALALGLLALPFLLYSVSQPILWEYGFRNARLGLLVVSLWGIVTLFGTVLMILSLIVGAVALILSLRQPTRYGGKALAALGPVLSILLMVAVIGAFAFRRMQGPTRYDIDIAGNSNDNSNENSNRSYNSNSASNSNSNSSSSSSTEETDDATDMSETDKYRLFYAAAKSGDTSLQQRAAKKVGIVDSGGMPTSTYQSFTKGMINWAFKDSAWVQTIDTPEKGRAYAEARLD
ncbi:MAG TPA: hypothetical protein VFX97_17335 [Pyrinomonadaceae bacterium]|nr:hypothetical protein [Pyrinomonadaceae bacterium]